MESSSYTFNATFTVTHAKYLASKVAADLKRIQRFYGQPNDKQISDYEAELTELLKEGYLDSITYGFKRAGVWIKPAVKYSSIELSNGNTDDDPGKIFVGADIRNAAFGSFLCTNSKWDNLSQAVKNSFRTRLPIQRYEGANPQSAGYFSNDLTYGSGGKAINRSSLK
ncbi:MAG: hypothetical protein HGB15_01550 [Chlorobaculum sp.]|nr:hypothetical protein [Chlorobaculum sp.]